jgi:fructokinase
MRTVYCIGEIVWDILIRDGLPVAAKAGGSMLNAAVSLGRAGNRVALISETGADRPGSQILSFLENNGVSTEYIRQDPGKKTAIALAFLDPSGDAEYSFYRDPPVKNRNRDLPVPGKEDIVLFGSYYSVSEDTGGDVAAFVSDARLRKAMILYDPNFRKSHLPQLGKCIPRILDNFSRSDLVRGSDGDFMTIFAAGNGREAYDRVREAGCKRLVYTRNKAGAELMTGKIARTFPVPEIRVKSTIGAGDAFNAGIIHEMMRSGICRDDLDRVDGKGWDRIIGTGIRFAGDVCSGFDNYISPELAKEVKSC